MFSRGFILLILGLFGLAVRPAAGSALHQAVRARDRVTLEALLESHIGSALNAAEADGTTPLHLAAATDQADIATLLLSRGADVAVTNHTGFTPLHWAASRNAVDTLRVLIEAGADPDAKAQQGITPLHWAAARNAVKAVAALIKAGADLNARTFMGYTPIHLAVKQNAYSETAVLLAQAGAEQQPDPSVSRATGMNARPDGGAHLPGGETNLPPAQPGMYLSVPLGLSDALSFVWIPNIGIWFGKYEITNNRYRRFRPEHSSRRIEGLTLDDPDQPAVYVSWHDAVAFCDWLNRQFSGRIPEGYAFRLPTEAEWMIAAGAGDFRIYPWGNDLPPVYGNYSDLTARRHFSQWRGISEYDDGYAATAPVQNSGVNELGIFGLAGNVWEWTGDWMDPQGQTFKIRKGGSWDFDGPESLAITARGLDRPDARYDTIGFRVVVAPTETAAPALETFK